MQQQMPTDTGRAALDALCRAKAGRGEEWSPYRYQNVSTPPERFVGVEVTGSNHRTLTRGPNKGQRRWTGEAKITVFVTAAEYSACFAKAADAAAEP